MSKSLFERIFFRGENLTKTQKKQLVEKIKPVLKSAEFKQVQTYADGEKRQHNSILFEKIDNEFHHYIGIVFEKYYNPRFFVSLYTVQYGSKTKRIQHVPLVKNSRQLYYFWGAKPWSINRNKAWVKSVKNVATALPQLFDFIDDGSVGKNISDHRFKYND